jgi:hypothetical protein
VSLQPSGWLPLILPIHGDPSHVRLKRGLNSVTVGTHHGKGAAPAKHQQQSSAALRSNGEKETVWGRGWERRRPSGRRRRPAGAGLGGD